MDSPLLQPVPTPKRRVVPGTHVTSHRSVRFTLARGLESRQGKEVVISFGCSGMPGVQYAQAADLRELATLFTELADVLDGGT